MDAGLAVCEDLGLVPDLAVGDLRYLWLGTDGRTQKKRLGNGCP